MKKGQASGGAAASFIALLGLIIVIYILFLPPQDREELLSEGTPSDLDGTNTKDWATEKYYDGLNETLMTRSPGNLNHLSFDEYEHDLPSLSIYTSTDSQEILEVNSFVVRSGWFDTVDKTISFEIEEAEQISNAVLTFESKIHKGRIQIKSNGNVIYEDYVDSYNVGPITVDNLKKNNDLSFSVSDVGWKFWNTNEYSINNLKLYGDVTDESSDEGKVSFYASYEEVNNLDSATLRFTANCNWAQDSRLKVIFNKREIFNALPDCGMLNRVTIHPGYFTSGENEVVFKSEKGSYVLDRIQVKTELMEPNHPVYMFDVDKSAFYKTEKESDPVCGEIDGKCPYDCEADYDHDCCFEEDSGAYWCDIPTSDSGDRCVKYVDENKCDKCESGYDDIDDEPHEDCEGLCGDDTDETCPTGCTAEKDADCCFLDEENESTGNFFCYQMPSAGVEYRCLPSVSTSQCQFCAQGYEDEEGKSDEDCKELTGTGEDSEYVLKEGYDVNISIGFVDDYEDKQFELYVNGHPRYYSTRSNEFSIIADSMIEPGTNSLKFVPKTTMNIRRIEVLLQ